MTHLLNVAELNVRIKIDNQWYPVLENINFAVDSGRVMGVVGESGCGKSMTALALMQLLPKNAKISGGKAVLGGPDGRDGIDLLLLDDEALRHIRGKKISYIFQEPMTALNPVYSVGHQVVESVLIHEPDRSKKRARERAIEMLSQVGIADPKSRFNDLPHELSGGMRQRVLIAMALICHPLLLIADEPTTALDVTIQAQILELIHSFQKERNMGVMLITHDLGIIAEHADEVAVFYAGQIVEKTQTSELFAHPLHPYTQGLLASLPVRHSKHEPTRLKGIAGMVPDLKKMPTGCRFYDRCGIRKDDCKAINPGLEKMVSQDHWVSCLMVASATK